MSARLVWWWRRWRAAHHQWLAYCDYYTTPSPENAARWGRAAEAHRLLVANPANKETPPKCDWTLTD